MGLKIFLYKKTCSLQVVTRSRQESNLDLTLRRGASYPLNDGTIIDTRDIVYMYHPIRLQAELTVWSCVWRVDTYKGRSIFFYSLSVWVICKQMRHEHWWWSCWQRSYYRASRWSSMLLVPKHSDDAICDRAADSLHFMRESLQVSWLSSSMNRVWVFCSS